jgi:hypothetical protein
MAIKSLEEFNFSKEERLIIDILRGKKIENFYNIDFSKFINLILMEEIYPFFYNFFSKNEEIMPKKFFKVLEIFYEKNKKNSLILKDETIKILNKFKENKITVIPMKGFLISELIYGNPYSRVFSDIDLFVFEKDLEKSIEILKKEGFSFDLNEMEEKFYKKFHFKFYNEYRLYKNDFLIELHFSLFPRRLKIKNFEKFLEFEKYNDILIFSKEWQIISISIHAFFHRFSLLKFIFDIHKFIEKFKIDFHKIYEIGNKLKFLKIIKICLTISHFLFDTEIPDFLKFKKIPNFLREFIFKEKDPKGYKKDLFSFTFISSFSQKIYYTFSLLNPDENVLNYALLPEKLFFLYYPLRFFLILKNRLT